MNHLEEITDRAHRDLEARTDVRDRALSITRTLIRHASHAIRAVHRDENDDAQQELVAAGKLAAELQANLHEFPSVYYAGYTQDALKEFAEASIVYALLNGGALPTPEELNLEYSTYLQGLAESVGEMRRRCLDILREGHSEEAERLLGIMDDIYGVLVTMDYPDAITGGLRRLTDLVRGIVERTRGDLTISLRQERLENSLRALESRLPG
ncbi:MAG TPA: haloacid dehalogenase [Anaerolineales bacterium]|nr:haloacid dehalogenase [Anaerolineales bacterium]